MEKLIDSGLSDRNDNDGETYIDNSTVVRKVLA